MGRCRAGGQVNYPDKGHKGSQWSVCRVTVSCHKMCTSHSESIYDIIRSCLCFTTLALFVIMIGIFFSKSLASTIYILISYTGNRRAGLIIRVASPEGYTKYTDTR